jgi:hypothetical protein
MISLNLRYAGIDKNFQEILKYVFSVILGFYSIVTAEYPVNSVDFV